jgi:hypothetical protein
VSQSGRGVTGLAAPAERSQRQRSRPAEPADAFITRRARRAIAALPVARHERIWARIVARLWPARASRTRAEKARPVADHPAATPTRHLHALPTLGSARGAEACDRRDREDL